VKFEVLNVEIDLLNVKFEVLNVEIDLLNVEFEVLKVELEVLNVELEVLIPIPVHSDDTSRALVYGVSVKRPVHPLKTNNQKSHLIRRGSGGVVTPPVGGLGG
jgi:hypothetical protein